MRLNDKDGNPVQVAFTHGNRGQRRYCTVEVRRRYGDLTFCVWRGTFRDDVSKRTWPVGRRTVARYRIRNEVTPGHPDQTKRRTARYLATKALEQVLTHI